MFERFPILLVVGIRLTTNHYMDASQLPIYEAIENLPRFAESDVFIDTQLDTQTSDCSRNSESPVGTASRPENTSKVVYPEEFWRKPTPCDAIGQEYEKSCLARTRT